MKLYRHAFVVGILLFLVSCESIRYPADFERYEGYTSKFKADNCVLIYADAPKEFINLLNESNFIDAIDYETDINSNNYRYRISMRTEYTPGEINRSTSNVYPDVELGLLTLSLGVFFTVAEYNMNHKVIYQFHELKKIENIQSRWQAETALGIIPSLSILGAKRGSTDWPKTIERFQHYDKNKVLSSIENSLLDKNVHC